jgi:PAS domain S-box-containing protein
LETLFETIFNYVTDGIAIYSTEGHFLEVNPITCHYLGYSKDELLQMKVLDLIPPEFREIASKQVAEKLSQNGGIVEMVCRCKDGSLLPIELNISPIEYNGSRINLAVVRNIIERKKTEKALKQSEQMYKQAYNLMQGLIESPKDVVIFALDREYRYFAFNKNHQMTMEHIWDANIEVGISMLSYITDSADREKAKVNFDRALAGEAFTIIEEYDDSSQNRRWYSNTYSPLKDDDENITGLTLLLTDITGHKLTEMELEKSREQFTLAVNGSHDGIWDWDLRDNSLYLSPRCKEMIGYEDHELPNEFSTLEDNIYPDDKNWIMNELEKSLKVKAPKFNIEFRLMHRNGSFIWVQARGVFLRGESSFVYRMAGSMTDITERKKAEIKIAEEAVRRRILIEQSSDGIVIVDQNGKVFEANWKYADMLGYSPEEVLTLHMWDWEALSTREECLRMARDIDESGNHFETRHKRKDGTFFDVEISSNAAMFGEQKLIFCVCRDITKRKRAEKELLNAKLEAESANRIKSQFLANMSHELRTPLNSIIGFSDIMNSKMFGELTEKQLRYTNNINESGQHLLELINTVLDLSKIEAGKMELDCEMFSVMEVFNEVLTQITPIASKKNISITIENEIQLVEMFADRLKFKQIMYNLLSNAIKFTHDNGKASIIVKKIGNNTQISVSDTGIGIPEHMLQDVFTPFTQIDSSNKRKYGGTGLGLSIVKQFVEMHNGEIWLESEEGKGSTFIFTIANNI